MFKMTSYFVLIPILKSVPDNNKVGTLYKWGFGCVVAGFYISSGRKNE